MQQNGRLNGIRPILILIRWVGIVQTLRPSAFMQEAEL